MHEDNNPLGIWILYALASALLWIVLVFLKLLGVVRISWIGVVLGLVTVFVWRRMAHKAPLHFSVKGVLTVVVGVVGALALGVGMCFCMVWSNLVLGVIVGLAGIVILLSLIPLTRGIRE